MISSPLLAQSTTTKPAIPNIYILKLPSSETGEIIQYQSPLIYKKWWNEVRICSNTTDVPDTLFDKLKWVSVASDGFMAMGYGPYMGFTYAWDDEIWVLERYKLDERLVKHELLHYLLWNTTPRVYGHSIEFITCNLMKS